ncbi:MAG: DUF7124 domain-containing protein [Halodesulfurarchaeum sp.]
MQTDPGGTNDRGRRSVRTDGGSRMPGIPSDDETGDPSDSTPESHGSEAGSAEGARMPGVPDSKGPAPAVESSGGSCEAPEQDREAEEEHDLTTAFTIEALASLSDPAGVVTEARTWSDWVGVVGDVDAPTMNTFLRRKGIDIDFFNGAGTPTERLSKVAVESSAFFSERLVLIGIEGQESVLPSAEWEFQPLEETAAEADWDLADSANT